MSKYLLTGIVVLVIMAGVGFSIARLMPTQQASTEAAPLIEEQELDDGEPETEGLPQHPTVMTASGNSIALDLLLYMPKKGMYRYGNEIYTYDMTKHTFTHIDGGDAATFEVLPGAFSFDLYAKDTAHVYCRGEILADADPATFRAIPNWMNQSEYRLPDGDHIYYQDKNHQYAFSACAAVPQQTTPQYAITHIQTISTDTAVSATLNASVTASPYPTFSGSVSGKSPGLLGMDLYRTAPSYTRYYSGNVTVSGGQWSASLSETLPPGTYTIELRVLAGEEAHTLVTSTLTVK